MNSQPSFKLVAEIRTILNTELGSDFGPTVFITQCSDLNIQSSNLKSGDLLRLSQAIIRAVRPTAGDEKAQRIGNEIRKLKVRSELDDLRGRESDPGIARRFADINVALGNICLVTGDFEEGKKAFRDAIRFTRTIDYQLKEAEANIGIGLLHERTDEWDEAIEFLNKGLAISEEVNYPMGIADASRWLGHLEWHRNNYDKALEWLEKGLTNAEKTGDDGMVGQVMIEFGLVYSDRGNLEKAVQWFNKSIPLLEGVRDHRQLSRVYNNIGDSLMQLKDWNKALEHFDKSEEYARMINNQQFIGWSLFNSGEALINIGELDKAIERGEQAYPMLETLGDTMGMQGSTRVQAIAYSKKKDWEKADKLFERVKEITDIIDSKYHTGQLLYDLGKMLIDKGDKAQAKKNYLEAKKLFGDIGAQRLLDDVTKDLESL